MTAVLIRGMLGCVFMCSGDRLMMYGDTPFRIGFNNGLMSESMIIWFGIMPVWTNKKSNS